MNPARTSPPSSRRLGRYLLYIILPLACGLFAEFSLPGGVVRRLFGKASDDPGVNIVAENHDGVTRLFVTTVNCLDITLTFDAKLENLRATPALPLTMETAGRRRVELVTLQPVDPAQPWHFPYTYHWVYGGRGGRPDDTVYELPFAAGSQHKLFQGYRGSFSHQAGSPDEYAHDWDLAENTRVLAARGGIVVGVRQDSHAGGASARFSRSANYVIIRHADGTYGEYLHLQPNGALVKLGDRVQTGQIIALSGNTGLSSRPHLHFAVFRAIDGSTRESLPVRFHTRDGRVETLEEGKVY